MTKDVKPKKSRIKVTDEQWKKVNPENRFITADFIEQSIHLSDKTLLQYESALKIYFVWISENLENKPYHSIRSIDYLRYQNWLTKQGLSSSGVRLKRSAISSINNYISTYLQDEHPNFHNYVTKAVKAPKLEYINKKKPLDLAEFKNLCDELENRKLFQQLAYAKFSFSSGARKSEARQLLKEVVNYEPKIRVVEVESENGIEEKTSKSYSTNEIRCKGSSKSGNIRKLDFGEDAMQAMKKWLGVRGDDSCEYMFALERNGRVQQVSEGAFNSWTSNIFSSIVGRRVYPHLLRSSRSTTLFLEQGVDIKTIQALLGHKSSLTTEIYIIDESSDGASGAFT